MKTPAMMTFAGVSNGEHIRDQWRLLPQRSTSRSASSLAIP